MRQLVEHQRIRTTLAKAKALVPHAERLVTLAKRGTPGSLTKARSILQSPRLSRTLVEDMTPRFASRPGGYTRIVKLNQNRFGDNSRMAYIEYVDNSLDPIIPPKEERRNSTSRQSVLEEKFWKECMGVEPQSLERRKIAKDLPTLRSRFEEIEAVYKDVRMTKIQRERELLRLNTPVFPASTQTTALRKEES